MHGALKGGLVDLPWTRRDGLGLPWKMEDEEELVYRGEGTTSLTVSSEDFCSREISEFEKLSCLHIRGGEMKTLHWLNMNYSRSFRLVSKVVLIVHTDWCLHSPSRTVRARGSPAGDWNPSGLTQTLGPSCRETDVLMWGCEESLLLSSLLTTSRAESVEFTENVQKE